MVIANSDSTSTLVSLDDALKRVSSLGSLQEHPVAADLSLRPTALHLPEGDDHGVLFDDNDGEEQIVYLPATTNSSFGADECLQCLPSLVEAGEDLLARPVVHYYTQQERILYVAQGEIADATAAQYDVLISDRATTCHILAVRSFTTLRKLLCGGALWNVPSASPLGCDRAECR